MLSSSGMNSAFRLIKMKVNSTTGIMKFRYMNLLIPPMINLLSEIASELKIQSVSDDLSSSIFVEETKNVELMTIISVIVGLIRNKSVFKKVLGVEGLNISISGIPEKNATTVIISGIIANGINFNLRNLEFLS